MITRAKDTDKADIIKELRKNVINNIYLYIDILIYGVNSEFVHVWIDKSNDNIDKIILHYHDSLQIYVSGICEYYDLIQLINEYRPSMISGRANLIKNLSMHYNNQYEATYGLVLSQPFTGIKCTNPPELARENDMEDIAQLVCSDKGIGGHYRKDDLKTQFTSRLKDGTGRNYIFRKNNKIIAHYATYAEAPEIAVMGGLIVAPEYRGKGYAKVLHCYLSDLIIKEHKEAILFCNEDNIINMYLKLGAIVRTDYGKLTLINNRP